MTPKNPQPDNEDQLARDLDTFLTTQLEGQIAPVPKNLPPSEANLALELTNLAKVVQPDATFASNLEARLLQAKESEEMEMGRMSPCQQSSPHHPIATSGREEHHPRSVGINQLQWMQQGVNVMKSTLRTSRQARRLSFAAIILLAVSSVAIISAPSLRVLAQEILNYFTRTRNDLVNVDIGPVLDENKLPPNQAQEWRKMEMEMRETTTVAQMESVRGFDLKEPTVVPSGLVLKQVFSPYPEIVSLVYDNSQDKTGLLITQQRLDRGEPMLGAVVQLLPPDKIRTEGTKPGAFAITFLKKPLSKDEPAFQKRGSTPVGASAKAETVQIGNTTGEYLEGVWEQSEEGKLRWVNNTKFRQIQWREGDVLFQILTPHGLSKDELVAMAKSMK